MQDEDTRRDKDDEKEIRSANFAKGETNKRCNEYQDLGHIGVDCPNQGKGKKCYKCNKFGNHIATSCTNQPGPSGYVSRGREYGRGDSRYKNTNFINQGRNFKKDK